MMFKLENDSRLECFTCDYCERTFNIEALKRHQIVCYKIHFKNIVNRYKKSEYKSEKTKQDDKIRDVLRRKINRRQNWRNDHYRFLEDLLSFKETSLKADNEFEENFKRAKTSGNETPTIFIDRYDSPEISSSMEPHYIEQSNNANRPFQKPGKFFRTTTEASIALSDLKSKYTSKLINAEVSWLNKTSHNERMTKSKDPAMKPTGRQFATSCNRDSRMNTSSREVVDNSGELNLYKDSSSVKDRRDFSTEARKYVNKVSRVLKYYNDCHWSKEDKSPQKVLDDIPNNLSSHKLRLERFKRFNNKMRLNGDVYRDGRQSVVSNQRYNTPDKLVTPVRKDVTQSNQSRSVSRISKNVSVASNIGSSHLSDSRYSLNVTENDLPECVPKHVQFSESHPVKTFVNVKLERFKEHQRNTTTSDHLSIDEVTTKPHDIQSGNINSQESHQELNTLVESLCRCCENNHGVTEMAPSIPNDNAPIHKNETILPKRLVTSKHNFVIKTPTIDPPNTPSLSKEEYKRAWNLKF